MNDLAFHWHEQLKRRANEELRNADESGIWQLAYEEMTSATTQIFEQFQREVALRGAIKKAIEDLRRCTTFRYNDQAASIEAALEKCADGATAVIGNLEKLIS